MTGKGLWKKYKHISILKGIVRKRLTSHSSSLLLRQALFELVRLGDVEEVDILLLQFQLLIFSLPNRLGIFRQAEEAETLSTLLLNLRGGDRSGSRKERGTESDDSEGLKSAEELHLEDRR